MSIYRTALNVYRAISKNPIAIKDARDKYAAAALAMTSTNGQMQIVESTVNGQNFVAKYGATSSDQLAILAQVVSFLDNARAGGAVTQGRFR